MFPNLLKTKQTKNKSQASSCGCYLLRLPCTCYNVLSCIFKSSSHTCLLLWTILTIDTASLWQVMFFFFLFLACDKSPVSNKTPDQAGPNYAVVPVLLPLETVPSRYPAVFSVYVWRGTFQAVFCVQYVSRFSAMCSFPFACAWQNLAAVIKNISFQLAWLSKKRVSVPPPVFFFFSSSNLYLLQAGPAVINDV